jgi:hypothetical protein
LITALHYLTGIQKAQFHDIYRRLYHIPIVLGGLWFTLRGGLGRPSPFRSSSPRMSFSNGVIIRPPSPSNT